MLDENEKVIKMTKKKRAELIKEKTGIKPYNKTVKGIFPREYLIDLFNDNKEKLQE